MLKKVAAIWLLLFIARANILHAQYMVTRNFGNFAIDTLFDANVYGISKINDSTLGHVANVKYNPSPISTTKGSLLYFNLNGNLIKSLSYPSLINHYAGFLSMVVLPNKYKLINAFDFSVNFNPRSHFSILTLDSSDNFISGKEYYSNDSLHNQYCHFIHRTQTGNIFLVGDFISIGGWQEKEIMIVKLDSSLNILWAKKYGKAGNQSYVELIEGYNNDIIIRGSTSVTTAGSTYECYLMSINDNTGNINWVKRYSTGNGFQTSGHSIIKNSAGGYMLSLLGRDMVTGRSGLLKLDSQGNILSEKTYLNGGPGRMSETKDGGFICSGGIIAGGWINGLLLKCDSLGNAQWHYGYNDGSQTIFKAWQMADGSYMGIGEVFGTTQPKYLIKTDSLGHSACNYYPVSTTLINNIFTSDTITFYDSTLTFLDTTFVLVKDTLIMPDSVICTGYSSIETPSQKNFQLTVYPNPAATTITIELIANAAETKTITISNLLNQNVLVKTFTGNKIQLDVRQLPKGMYFVNTGGGGKQCATRFVKD